ncbi:MAG: AI-2E family transporter, partial [Ginsengibacter sp.]
MQQLPLTVRRAIELVGIYFFGMIIIVGKDVINPLVMAFFFSIMLLPLYRWFRKKKLPEMLSISLSLLLLIIIVGLAMWFFSSQITRLVADFPQIKANVKVHLQSLSLWLDAKTGISTERQTE